MKIGIRFTPTAYAVDAVDLALAAEDLGFDCIVLPEHTHVPVQRETAYLRGGDMPKEYLHVYSQLITLAAIAGRTSQLKLVTGVCLVTEHDPIILAKDIATLDQLSNGRVILGVGAGWNREEMRNHGTDPATRWAVLRERVRFMQAIWTEEEASFAGDHVRVDALWSWPKPVQRPHPPILIGGHAKRVAAHVVEYADGWLPQQVDGRTYDDLESRIAEMQRSAADRGRGPIQVTVMDPVSPPPTPDDLHRYTAIGVERCVLRLPCVGPDEVMPLLRRYAKLITATE